MLNRITMTGRLVADPELRRTQSGVSVTSFRIANDRDYGKGEEKETDFFDVVAWRSTAEFICKYFTKGRMISVDGRLQTRGWKDREGNNRVSIEILVDNAYFADSKKDDAAGDFPADDQFAGYGAVLSIVGTHNKPPMINALSVCFNQQHIMGCGSYPYNKCFEDTCNLIRSGVDLSRLVTHKFTLDQLDAGMAAHGDANSAQKVAIIYD